MKKISFQNYKICKQNFIKFKLKPIDKNKK